MLLLLLYYVIAVTTSIFGRRLLEGLPSRCPPPETIQSCFLISSSGTNYSTTQPFRSCKTTLDSKPFFNISKLEGVWYELAHKDAAQPRACKCQTSHKTVDESRGIIWDKFTIECYNGTYYGNLSFHYDFLDDQSYSHSPRRRQPGVLIGTWNQVPLFQRIRIPDTIVDVGVTDDDDNDPNNGTYEWMIEFQCIDAPRFFGREWGIAFYGMQFYARNYSRKDELVHTMEERARTLGLGPFIDHYRGLKIVDHSNCIQGH
eukprot:scaffold36212_cov53-Attheya_sp.AAC.1